MSASAGTAAGETTPLRARLFDARLILLIGLGGLLALMTAAGIYTIRSLGGVRARHEAIRALYLERNRTLNQIRSDLYLSSTYIRDYLLDPDVRTAQDHRERFETTRADLERRTEQYAALMLPEQRQRWQELRASLDQLWALLAPIWSWDQDTRRQRGYDFYRDEVVARRSHLLGLADEVGALNEQQLTRGDRELDDVFDAVHRRLLLALVLSLICGGALTVISVAKLVALERSVSEQYQQTLEARRGLQELSARIVSAQEEERKNISRELHDEVGQSLSALLVGLSNIRAAVPPGERPELDRQLATMRQMTEESARVVRNMSLLLRPSMLDDLGLVAALQWQAREVSRNHGLAVELQATEVPDELPDEHATCIYRVVQEALHNAARHSGARRVEVRLMCEPGSLALSVRDDGRGIPGDAVRGLGILGMRERVIHLGGSFRIQSQPGEGTELNVRLPLNCEAA